ncbi:MAG: TetR/AcrR family transcriptional regulator [Coriobacteriales bacterium]
MGESDSRTVAATKRRITDGLFEIMRDDPIERVTVREVCARAHITRSTFYTHFSSVYDVRDRCEAEIAERVEQVFFPEILGAFAQGGRRGCARAARRVEEALGDHFDHLAVLLNGGDRAFVERARTAAMDAVCSHLGIRSMSERQALVFYGTSSMLLGMYARWLSSERAMPLEELVATARTAVLRGPARAMFG